MDKFVSSIYEIKLKCIKISPVELVIYILNLILFAYSRDIIIWCPLILSENVYHVYHSHIRHTSLRYEKLINNK